MKVKMEQVKVGGREQGRIEFNNGVFIPERSGVEWRYLFKNSSAKLGIISVWGTKMVSSESQTWLSKYTL